MDDKCRRPVKRGRLSFYRLFILSVVGHSRRNRSGPHIALDKRHTVI
jgi:hypothetical protein